MIRNAGSSDGAGAIYSASVPPVPNALLGAVRRRLQESSHRALLRIECYDHEGVVTLQGRVPSYYLKQVAQELVGRVPGVEAVSNYLEVVSIAGLSTTAIPSGPEGCLPRRTWPSIDP
jgi:hypothetical protein